MLHLTMPVMSGHEFLKRVKNDDRARDIRKSYHEYASSYVVKPGSFSEYLDLLTMIGGYWRGAVRLPTLEQIGAVPADPMTPN